MGNAVNYLADKFEEMKREDPQGKITTSKEVAEAIINAVLMLEVKAGIPVSTTGTATAQSGATTSNGTLIDL